MSLFISRATRKLLSLGADPILARTDSSRERFREARRLSGLINERASVVDVTAGELNALASFVEVLRHLVGTHLARFPGLLEEILLDLRLAAGSELVDELLTRFADEFALVPTTAEPSLSEAGVPQVEILKELLIFQVVAANPAADPVSSWLGNSPSLRRSEFAELVHHLEGILFKMPSSSSKYGSWGDELWAPSRTAPFSLADQLRFLGKHWALDLDDGMDPVVAALDLIAEEEAPRFSGGPGPVELPAFEHLVKEVEAFTLDSDWMPGLVLLAKNCLIWLQQLSEKYGRAIKRLDEVPDEEFEAIADRGFTGLWLIGVWERSAASKQIKHLTGNTSAEASAYALAGYRVATKLGGEQALVLLRQSAAKHGIRLATDMTPNHLGVDSDWVCKYPERFLSSSTCPFPSYAFSGPDLSGNEDVGIYLEDHYLDRSDAAVVFKRVDRAGGEERFIYHGNDGTNTPWNDTAQLDYLNAETREAVIYSILKVARQFSVIRFDAAMTLARQHIQRLWFPQPGHGGAIPSRAEHALPPEIFDKLMPKEFWREVVDRVQAEVPGTLLLAEAFWLMEGYFVRSLGMHRVYNSAFMNLLRDGENAKLRNFIRETLEFDRRILERYVNFLTNPDERTAIEQFGASDRYFGACVLLVTLPGLPMFGHGQFEGNAEKYGMEYGRAYHEEPPNDEILVRHRREIVPLLRRREHFSSSTHFRLLDFVEHHEVNENVFAFSNLIGSRSVLVVVNNSEASARGRVADAGHVAQFDLRPIADQGAGLEAAETQSDPLVKFTDSISGRSYLRSSEEFVSAGLSLNLEPYGYAVFEDFERVVDDDLGSWRRLADQFEGEGIESLEEALRYLAYEPAFTALKEIVENESFTSVKGPPNESIALVNSACSAAQLSPGTSAESLEAFRHDLTDALAVILTLPRLVTGPCFPETERLKRFVKRYQTWLERRPEVITVMIFAYLVDTMISAEGNGIDPGGDPGRIQLLDRLDRFSIFIALEQSLKGILSISGGALRAAELTQIARVALRDGWVGDSEVPGNSEFSLWVEPEAKEVSSPTVPGQKVVDLSKSNGSDDFLLYRLSFGLIAVGCAGTDQAEQARAENLVAWCDVFERLIQRLPSLTYLPESRDHADLPKVSEAFQSTLLDPAT